MNSIKAVSSHLEGKLESVLKAKRLSAAQREQTPIQYREMVNEYYERLAKRGIGANQMLQGVEFQRHQCLSASSSIHRSCSRKAKPAFRRACPPKCGCCCASRRRRWSSGCTAVRARSISPLRRKILIALRSVTLIVLLIMILGPTLRLPNLKNEETFVAVMLDASKSMTIEDSTKGAQPFRRRHQAAYGRQDGRRTGGRTGEELRGAGVRVCGRRQARERPAGDLAGRRTHQPVPRDSGRGSGAARIARGRGRAADGRRQQRRRFAARNGSAPGR